MSRLERLRPANRHFLIVPHTKKNETNAGVLLPEDYKPEQDRYIEASVVDIADDCSEHFRRLKYSPPNNNKIVVDRTMIQEVKVKNRTHFMILENYVVGFFRGPNEG